MTESLNVASCGECFETWSEPAQPSMEHVNEAVAHQETEGHRLDVWVSVVE